MKSLRERRRPVGRRCFTNFVHPGLRRSAVQPDAQFLDRVRRPLNEDFDGAVRQILRDAPDEEPPGLEAGTVPKIHTLNFPKNEKAANDFFQLEGASVRQRRGRIRVLRAGIGKRG
jgi:hypothetical protein